MQLVFAISLLGNQAAALDHDQDPEQLWDIGWELSQDCFTYKDAVRVKGSRHSHLPGSGLTVGKLPQGDLLQDLLTSSEHPYVANKNPSKKSESQKCRNAVKKNDVSLEELSERSVMP
jgi:hypothetical protein